MKSKKGKEEQNQLLIPFIKPVRVGNFKLWRGKYVLKSGKDSSEIECIHVSNLDGSWMIRIPSTMSLFATICNGYATVDKELRNNFLGMILSNIYNIGTSSSEALHDALFFLTEMMTFPYLLLPEKEMQKRMEKAMKARGFDKGKRKEHIGRMCDYRKQLYELVERKKERLIDEYERQQGLQLEYERVAEAEDLKNDELAEQSIEILNEKSNDGD